MVERTSPSSLLDLESSHFVDGQWLTSPQWWTLSRLPAALLWRVNLLMVMRTVEGVGFHCLSTKTRGAGRASDSCHPASAALYFSAFSFLCGRLSLPLCSPTLSYSVTPHFTLAVGMGWEPFSVISSRTSCLLLSLLVEGCRSSLCSFRNIIILIKWVCIQAVSPWRKPPHKIKPLVPALPGFWEHKSLSILISNFSSHSRPTSTKGTTAPQRCHYGKDGRHLCLWVLVWNSLTTRRISTTIH